MHAGTKQVKQVCEIILCKEIEITKAAVKGRMMPSNGMQIRKKKKTFYCQNEMLLQTSWLLQLYMLIKVLWSLK